MGKIKSVVTKPRNIYFSIVLMLTLVTGLASISFSYYIDESNTEGLFKLKEIDNRIQSDDLIDGKVSLAPHETKTITVNVMSNNNTKTKFALYYKTEDDVKVFSEEKIASTIDKKELQEYVLLVSNFSSSPASVYIDIESGQLSDELVVDGKLVQILE